MSIQAGLAAEMITSETYKADVLARAAGILAGASYDLVACLADQAEYVAESISALPSKAQLLAQLSSSAVGYDPGRAARPAARSEQPIQAERPGEGCWRSSPAGRAVS